MDLLRRLRVGIVAVGAALTVVGALGLGLGWGTSSPGPRSATSSTTEAPAFFFSTFVSAVRDGNRSFLFDRMDPAVIARYGTAACEAVTAHLIDPAASLRLVEVTGPGTYDYTSSGRSTQVPNTYTFTSVGAIAGINGTHHYHFALLNGRFHIFVNCQSPGP